VLAEGVYVGAYEKMDRVTVVEAAVRLGVKEQAIRKRIQRGTIAHDKDDDGRVHVYLAPDNRATGTGTGVDTSISTLVQSLQDQIAYLRQEAEDWKEEARRKDTIIMSLTQRLPELEAPAGPQAASADRSAKGPGRGSTVSLQSQEPSQRHSWPHRFFFGP
jgi:hypothetical protein